MQGGTSAVNLVFRRVTNKHWYLMRVEALSSSRGCFGQVGSVVIACYIWTSSIKRVNNKQAKRLGAVGRWSYMISLLGVPVSMANFFQDLQLYSCFLTRPWRWSSDSHTTSSSSLGGFSLPYKFPSPELMCCADVLLFWNYVASFYCWLHSLPFHKNCSAKKNSPSSDSLYVQDIFLVLLEECVLY